MNVHREIADFVDNQHPVLGQHFELVRQAVFIMRFFELLNELVAIDVVSREPMLCCYKAQGGGQMGLAHAGRSARQKKLCKRRQATVKRTEANRGFARAGQRLA